MIGGITPSSGAHSMIDSPDPVSRVAPPSAIITSNIAQIANSQDETCTLSRCRRRSFGSE